MSPIGRIFIVLNLVLAAVFLGWAANALSTTDDYRAKFNDKQTELDDLRKEKDDEIAELNIKINSLEDQNRTSLDERDDEVARADGLKTQLDEAKRANEQMRGNLQQIEATLGDFNNTIAQLNSEKDAAVAAQRDAESERDDAVASSQDAQQLQRDAEDAKRMADQVIADLEAEKVGLVAKVDSLEAQKAMIIDMTGVSVSELVAAPKIDAQVLDVRLDLAPGLVMLNAGKNKNVKRGYTFEIWRGGTYKGQVRVEDVQDNVCSALIKNAVPGTTITQGDQASTML